MDWYYQENGAENGPISADDLKALFKAKTISAETQVRRTDMPQWRPLRQFVKGAATPPPEPETASADTMALEMENQHLDQPPASPPPVSHCSECGGAHAPDDLIRFDNALVCAACKPLFTQKLREGVRVDQSLDFAGFWIRFGAKFIDGLIVTVINLVVGFVLGFAMGMGGFDGSEGDTTITLTAQLLNLLIAAVYSTYLVGRYGATLGKMACGLKVVRPDGGSVSYLRALGRHFAEFVSGLILMIGYIMAAFDSEKRALHDHICNTRVVRK